MPLIDLPRPTDNTAIPGDVRAFLREADRRIETFQREASVPAFVSSDFPRVYQVLRDLESSNLASGNLFCEWGSGFGVVACLAAMLGFDAVGIEIDEALVDAAEDLAGHFELPVEFIRGSFIPRGGEVCIDVKNGHAWLDTSAADIAFDPADFDVIFAYPWPDEEGATDRLFERFAAEGAILVTYHGGDDIRVRRKRSAKVRRPRK
ncbi:MAG: class I SAM-dependent methyltransferase [Planctomycetes bacterium]|nr:class I SAM-dependent methyltransferase [Planctomycetota bacterium]